MATRGCYVHTCSSMVEFSGHPKNVSFISQKMYRFRQKYSQGF